jgi:heme-degrading monooxygenase HmoA
MWVRASRLRTEPGSLDKLAEEFKSDTVAKLKGIPGNAGAVLLVNRPAGVGLALTYWRDRAALDASETAATGLRTGVASGSGAVIESVQRAETVIMEREGTPQAGSFVRAIQFSLDAGQVDGGLEYMRSTVLPELRKLDGFRALICNVNRESGLGVVSTVWATRQALQASDAAMAPMRGEALERFGAGNVSVEELESVYVDVSAPITT